VEESSGWQRVREFIYSTLGVGGEIFSNHTNQKIVRLVVVIIFILIRHLLTPL
jgi:hypothetical protein